ncbi:hypothetical protein [Amycolatopsis methanolica]|uniref:Uncharacterized protein n=1 Tax=Amycolatopsis methanolica 239 TaxID=1068978 RepID=A0A076N0Q5_AMYME|nr:hypothetical protein [Amycolatopsis methanolica]AIJ26369.1 hypothetical protein AMETH_6277 [Amycolatopsis methanolica 239]AIJ26428.1 hypothetical protein AMETH_6336 [Amycolatopsis methanolica 239]
MLSNLVEAVGYALVVAFLYLLWPPLALLGAGLLLVVWANLRPQRKGSPLAGAIGAALGAARSAWRAEKARGDG